MATVAIPAEPHSSMRGVLMQTTLHVVAILLVLVVASVRHWSWRDNLGIVWPPARAVVLWLGVFIALLVIEEIARRLLHLPAPQSWRGRYDAAGIAVRAASIVLTAPAFEELVFRGLVYDRVAHTPAGPIGAIVVAAVVFAGMHIQYSRAEIAFILVDGIFFGVVRYATGSVLLTFALHSLGNLYALAERLKPTT